MLFSFGRTHLPAVSLQLGDTNKLFIVEALLFKAYVLRLQEMFSKLLRIFTGYKILIFSKPLRAAVMRSV